MPQDQLKGLLFFFEEEENIRLNYLNHSMQVGSLLAGHLKSLNKLFHVQFYDTYSHINCMKYV